MTILTRYLLRLHLAPFVFALGALTGFMLVNQIAKRFGDLVGKGLPWHVIVEVFALSLPFIIAMTLPMAVLVAVLYGMSRLTADNEITAMRAGGVSLATIMRPLLIAGAAVAVGSFLFSDQILPRSNHRLRTLYSDIARKKPTFSLKEQVINEVQRNRFFLRAARIDPGTYALHDVTIFDLADQDRKRVIYADSGYLALTPNQEDAELTLFDGVMHEFDRRDPGMFQQAAFTRQRIRVEGVGNELQRTLTDSYKGDREMGICEMEGVVQAARHEAALARRRAAAARANALRGMVGLPVVAPDTVDLAVGPPSPYCRMLRTRFAFLLPDDLQAQRQAKPGDTTVTVPPSDRPAKAVRPLLHAGAAPLARSAEVRTLEDRMRAARIRAAHYLVEIHKKYAIAAACLVFVIVGVPMALRFPAGGVGLVIGASLGVFAIYYIGLIAGESLADRLIVPPWIMWVPNLIFTLVGVALLRRARTEATTARATDWRDALARLVGRRPQ